jgi:nitrite reductase/ring-hydroxylating ferredoxin subunit
MTATSSQSNTPSPPARPEHYIGRLEDLPLHKVHRVEIEGRDIGIIRTTNSVHAIGNQCPHQGGPMCFGHVTGTMLPSEPDEYVYGHDGLVVRCPWHAYEFPASSRDESPCSKPRFGMVTCTARFVAWD